MRRIHTLSFVCLLVTAASVALTSQSESPARPAGQATPLIEAARMGDVDSARVLIAGGADLNVRSRGFGTALEAAERQGHKDLANLLRQAGAKTFGRSTGDTVCVRPWNGDGFCGRIEDVDGQTYRLRVTEIVGCGRGCDAKPDCSAGKTVGGSGGLRDGDLLDTPSWCITDTDVVR